MYVFLVFLLWRSLLFIISIYNQNLPFTPSFPYSDIYFFPSGLPRWIWAWANFDGVHYITIAKSGYMAQFTQAFFPLFPLFIHIVTRLFNDNSIIISGLIISNICFLLALFIFKNLLNLDFRTKEIKWIIAFLILFPTSFYYGSFYTESIFLLLVLLSFWFSRKKHWWLCGFCGGLASLTRIIGIFLLPALIYEKYLSLENKSKLNISKSIRSILLSPILFLVPSGLISYMVYLQVKFNDWLYFWHAQSMFGAERSSGGIILPFQTIWRYCKILSSFSIMTYSYKVAVFEVSVFILAVIFLIFAHIKKVHLPYLIFAWFVVLIPSFTGTLSSMPRYVLPAFSIFISLGLIKSVILKIILLIIFSFLLFVLTNLFLQGLWVA